MTKAQVQRRLKELEEERRQMEPDLRAAWDRLVARGLVEAELRDLFLESVKDD